MLSVELVGLLCLAFGSAFAESGPASPPGLFRHLQHICAGINNSYDCAKAVEADRFKKGILGVSRKAHELVITPSASPAVVLADSDVEGSPHGQRYSYIDYVPALRSHVVYVQYYEGGVFLLVDSVSGQTTTVWSMPIASPNASRFVTACDAFAYGPNGLQIWRVTPGGPVLEWSHDAKDWGPGTAQWLDASTIAVSADGLADEITLPPEFPTSITVTFRNEQWIIEGLLK